MKNHQELAYFARLAAAGSDGCTFFPDLGVRGPCVKHDFLYRTPKELTGYTRLQADKRLYRDFQKKGRYISAIIVFLGVRLFGVKAYRDGQKAGEKLLAQLRERYQ